MENNTMPFTWENIQKGVFGGKNGKSSNWNQFASLRLLLESGQKLSEVAKKTIEDIKYKWYYYNRKSDNNKGNIIIGLHKKDVEGWVYLVIDTKTGEIKDFNKIVDAKDYINGLDNQDNQE
jgi:hypothetical protein